ncbi:MAG: hypothetical protein G01um10147_854 [Microgenomates group bacterium Gr01-1014_7]|nr:MAG: hypothetical protein G01um10147_854 [Microgenomates group bacterium Gr01-1014_7]
MVISAVAAMVVGSLWYGPLFGKAWMKLVGISKDDVNKKDIPKMYGTMFIGALIEAYILSLFIHYAGAFNLILGAKTGLWAWLGFVATTMIGNYMFAKRPMNLYFIDAGYALANLLVMGAILGSMF